MKTIQSIIEEFDKKFDVRRYDDPTEDSFYGDTSGYNPDNIKSFILQALADQLSEVRELVERILNPHGYESDDPSYEKFALQLKEKYKSDILSALKEKGE